MLSCCTIELTPGHWLAQWLFSCANKTRTCRCRRCLRKWCEHASCVLVPRAWHVLFLTLINHPVVCALVCLVAVVWLHQARVCGGASSSAEHVLANSDQVQRECSACWRVGCHTCMVVTVCDVLVFRVWRRARWFVNSWSHNWTAPQMKSLLPL